MIRLFSIFMVSVLFLFAYTMSPSAQAKKNTKYASLVMDADTGIILSQRYADSKRYPASLTKIMTLLMVFEALDRGDLKKRDRVYISKYAASMVPSKFYLKPGQYIRVEDAIYALVTKSANDVAVGLAEKIGGTESRFAQMMTTRARAIGMKKTRFRNASGLPNRSQITTARDMATLARYMLQRYPHYYRYFSTRNFNYNGKSYRNHNRLLDSYKGMDGFKTGYINASGFNLVASARQNNRRLIGVVFGGRSSASRNSHMAEILDTGFKKVRKIRTAFIKDPPVPKVKPITQTAALNELPVVSTQPPVPKKNSTVTNNSNYNTKLPSSDLTRAIENEQFGIVNPEVAATPQPTIPNEWDSAKQQPVSLDALPHPKNTVGKWSIQIGAFESRVKTDDILRSAIRTLPTALNYAVSPLTVPLQTADGTLFRARLGGFSQMQATQACTYFKDCMTIAPRSVKISTQ